MKIYQYRDRGTNYYFTTELSEFDMVMNQMVLVNSPNAADGHEWYLTEIEEPLSRLLNIMPGTNKEYKMYQLVAFLEAIAKEDGHDLGWEHKKTTPYHRE